MNQYQILVLIFNAFAPAKLYHHANGAWEGALERYGKRVKTQSEAAAFLEWLHRQDGSPPLEEWAESRHNQIFPLIQQWHIDNVLKR